MHENIGRWLAEVTSGEPVTSGKLTAFPLTAPGVGPSGIVTLDEAFAAGDVAVTEISESGAVPEIRFTNNGAAPVLILDGEELVGAKQNRIVNLTILAPALRTITIPVSCVEQGRWAYRSSEFSSAKRTVYASLRARKSEQVSRNLAERGSRSADQGEIWTDIATKARRMQSESPTGAMAEMYERRGADVADLSARLKLPPGACGAAFAIRGEVKGLDLFGDAATFGKLWPKLVASYALDAIEAGEDDFAVPGRSEAQRLVSELTGPVQQTSFPAVGEGTDLRIQSARVSGAALVTKDGPVHLCAFRREPVAGPGRAGRVASASRRRAWTQQRREGAE